MTIPDPIKEGLKEGGRIILLGVVSWFITDGVDLLLQTVGGKLDPSTKIIISGLLTTALKSLDKLLHEVGKASEEETGKASKLTAGLARF